MYEVLDIGVCEDETPEKERLLALLRESNVKNKTACFSSGEDFLANYKRDNYDLLLMDIHMEGPLTGIDVVRKIRDDGDSIPVAFITTSKEFALESYRLSTIKYIVKPVYAKELEETLNMAKLVKEAVPSLILQKNGAFKRTPFSRVMYIEQQGRRVFVHALNKDPESYYEKLSTFSLQLPEALFFLPHKSFAVNLSFVKEIDSELRCFVMSDGQNIPIRRDCFGKAKKKFQEFLLDSSRNRKK